MTNNQNQFSRFWQELKRRKVIYVITVYASSAFVIIELDPLNTIILVTYTYALLCADDCEAAMTIAEKALAVDPENFLTSNQLYETAAHCGEYDVVMETNKLDL